MIKCRVKQKGLKFYPQYRNFIFWKSCPESEWQCDKFKDDLSESDRILYILRKKNFSYNTLKDAESCLIKFVKEVHPIDTYKGYTIKVANNVSPLEYNYPPKSRTYYYAESYSRIVSDCVVYPICGETLKEVMTMIDILENKKKLSKVRKIYMYDE